MDATAEEFNIRASICKHLESQLQGSNGLPTDIEAANWWWWEDSFDPSSVNYHVRASLRETQGTDFNTVNGANGGRVMEWVLYLDLYVKREHLGRNLGTFPRSLTLLRSAFKRNQEIAVKDWVDTQDALGPLIVRNRQRHFIKPESDYVSGGWIVGLQWIEEDVA